MSKHPWVRLLTGVKGCSSFAKAVASGDVASPEEFQAKRLVCMDCEDRVERWGSSWCGDPFVETDRTCGCNLAGMLRVRSKRCIQGKHDSVLSSLTLEGRSL